MPNRVWLPFRGWPIAAYGCIGLALSLVIALGFWGAYTELRLVRSTLLQAEVAQMRTTAVRRVGYLESGLERNAPSTHLAAMAGETWFQRYWQNILPASEKYLYTAIVDPADVIVLHSNPKLQGQSLEKRWYDRVAWEAGENVYEVTDTLLSEDRHAYDIRIPILMNSSEVGEYHEGLSAAWFDAETARQQHGVLLRWGLVVGGTLLVVLAAVGALCSLARRSFQLRTQIDQVKLSHVSEIEKLAAGIVHEIRNPLHAFRLNLHALRRMHEGRAQFSPEEVTSILEESNREIERVERLLQELLGFASPEKARAEVLDVGKEVQSTLNFLKQDLLRDGISVQAEIPAQPLLVCMDAGRLRQIMSNLLMNAKEAVASGGKIDIKLERRAARIQITVKDNGPGITQKYRDRIFDPFFTTKKSGSGLGLALVKRFVEEVHGTVSIVGEGPGATFRVELPETGRTNRKDK